MQLTQFETLSKAVEAILSLKIEAVSTASLLKKSQPTVSEEKNIKPKSEETIVVDKATPEAEKAVVAEEIISEPEKVIVAEEVTSEAEKVIAVEAVTVESADLSQGLVVESFEMLTIAEDGLYVGNQRVALYVYDKEESSLKRGYPKYHIFNCRSAKDMITKPKQKYRLMRPKEHEFILTVTKKNKEPQDISCSLPLCKHCLNTYNQLFSTSYTIEEFEEQKILNQFFDIK